MHARWICGLALLAISFSGINAGERDVRFSIGGRFRDDEPLESRTKRNLELRELIREATAREQPPLHLGEVAFDFEKILPAPNADGKNIGPWTTYFTEQDRPYVVQLKNDLVRIECQNRLEWVARSSLVTPSQLVAASTAYLSKHPQESAAYAQRGTFRVMGGRRDEAISDLTHAINLRPETIHFLAMRASLWLVKKQLAPMFDDLDELIAIKPEDPNVYLFRATAFLTIDDYENAISDLSEAIRLGCQESDVFLSRGRCRLEKGEYYAAAEDFSKAIEYLPKDEPERGKKEAFLYYHRAYAYREIGRRDVALAEFTLAIELDPTDALPFIQRGNMYAARHENSSAFDDFDEAIRLVPTKSDGYAFRAKLQVQIGDYDKAIADFSTAIRLEPGAAHYWTWRAWVRFTTDDYSGAVDDLTQARKLDVDNIEVLEARALAYDKLGDSGNAILDRQAAERLKQVRESREEFQKSLR